jgi:hypothetical protein
MPGETPRKANVLTRCNLIALRRSSSCCRHPESDNRDGVYPAFASSAIQFY